MGKPERSNRGPAFGLLTHSVEGADLRLGTAIIAWIICTVSLDGTADAESLHAWVQLGPNETAIVRAATDETRCPTLQFGGAVVEMRLRAPPDQDFPVRVCEVAVPRSTRSLAIDGRKLPVVPQRIDRIGVIGDTGCRIKGRFAQGCNDPEAWPFAAIGAEVAARAPDLVIHVGDYLYRQSPCPTGVDCQGSPYGYNWSTWAADWFEPARALLSATPLLFVRGNHEQCGRASKGWFRFLASGPRPKACEPVSEAWAVRLGGLGLIVFDSSAGPAPHSDPAYADIYESMARESFATVRGETWFLTHRPLWAFLKAFGTTILGDRVQRDAIAPILPEDLMMIVSGHLHGFQMLDFHSGPVQLISGNAGTRLDPMPNETMHGVPVADETARMITSDSGFGFAFLDRGADERWRLSVYDRAGRLRHDCDLKGRTLDCRRDGD